MKLGNNDAGEPVEWKSTEGGYSLGDDGICCPKDPNDMVNNPKHYEGAYGMKTIDVIEEFTADLNGIEATDTGNIIKYILRWKKKNGLQDLKKARWYLNHLIDHIEKHENTIPVTEEESHG
jgi:hypothetical protein